MDDNALDKFIKTGAGFDPISPILAMIGNLINGPHYIFLIPHVGCHLTGHEIGKVLRRGGVRSWGRMIINETITVSVKLEQARWAQQLLEQKGIVVENPIADAAPQRPAPRPAQKAPALGGRRWTCRSCGRTYQGRRGKCPHCGGGYSVGWRK